MIEKHVLLPRLPFLEFDVDPNAGVLQVILKRQHDAFDRLAFLRNRHFQRKRKFLPALFHDAVGTGSETGIGEQRPGLLRIEGYGLDVQVIGPTARCKRPGDHCALAVEERVEHLLAVHGERDRLAHVAFGEQRVAQVVTEK